MHFANEEEDAQILAKRKICSEIIHRDNIGNWDELNRDLIEDKLECAICYNIIFYHDSVSQRLGPLAFQCNFCQNNLMCNDCSKKLRNCPFCKRDDSVIEPASQILIDEFKKIKFVCLHSKDNIQNKKGFQCEITRAMSPKELFWHIGFECKIPTRLNRYTFKSRDRQICKYFCTNESYEHKFTDKSSQILDRMNRGSLN